MVSYVTGVLLVCLYQIGSGFFLDIVAYLEFSNNITTFTKIFEEIILNQNCSFEFFHNHSCTIVFAVFLFSQLCLLIKKSFRFQES